MDLPKGSGQTILIVDDDQNHVLLLKKRLEASGYVTIVARDGVDGLNQAIHQRPDLIITDVLLPRMNGFQLVEQLKTNPETSTVPVIMMSAVYVTDEDMARGFELGAETYVAKADLALRKPLQEELLLEAAAILLQRDDRPAPQVTARVLIVDDDPEAVRLITKRLQPEGYQLEIARDGEEALTRAMAQPFDLVLLDVKLPKVDGLEVLSRLKTERPETTVVMMTAYGSEQVAVEALRRGADDYLVKPLEENEPVPTVRQSLKSSRRRAEVELASAPLRQAAAPEMEDKERLIEELRQSSITLMDQYDRLLAAEEQNRAYAEQLENMVDDRTRDLRRRTQELAALHSVLSAATGSLEPPEVMAITMQELDKVLGASAAAAFVVDPETGRLRLVAQHDLPEDFLRQVTRAPGSEGVLAKVLAEGEGIRLTDLAGDPLLAPLAAAGSVVIFPMKSSTEVVGLILSSCDRERDIDESGWKLLDAIGEEIGVVVENVRLYENLRLAYLATIRSLAEAVDAKDKYTRGHSDRVAAFAVAIARELELDAVTISHVRDAGYLHDIGKIGTPDSVLLKDGVLSGPEMEQMRLHPGDSFKIVTQAQFSPDISRMIRHHHERFDGSGYPDGLKELDIPLGSRILAVADAYEAMTSDRPYREGLTLAAAVAEIKRCSGGQFDPKVVTAFLRIKDSVRGDGTGAERQGGGRRGHGRRSGSAGYDGHRR
ncbi:MAG: response regulator [Thermoleophilia bacterium]